MLVLVTGATGCLGAHVVARLASRGHPVRALARPGRDVAPLRSLGVEIAEGDLDDERALRQACRGIEGLVHCARSRSAAPAEARRANVEGAARLYRAAHEHGVARIVHVSSRAALGATARPRRIDEAGAGRDALPPDRRDATGIEAEERARAGAWGGMPIVIVNPGHLAGARLDGLPGPEAARLARGRLRIVPPGGASIADVEDVADGATAALVRGRPGERYLLGGHDRTWLEYASALARAIGVAPPLFAVPAWLAPRRGFLYADSSKAARELGYSIRPFEEIVRRTAAGARQD